jgi:TonB family protein
VRTPLDVKPVEFRIPMTTVDAPAQLPGNAIEIDPAAAGRGNGPGAGAGPGAGDGTSAGPGAGAGRPGAGDGFEVGNGVSAPQLIHEVRPAYTAEAMRAKVQGRVELDVVVLPDGTVDQRRIRIVRSLDSTFGLDAQAIDAVKQWRFRPGRRLDQPVPVRVRVELTFTLR